MSILILVINILVNRYAWNRPASWPLTVRQAAPFDGLLAKTLKHTFGSVFFKERSKKFPFSKISRYVTMGLLFIIYQR